MAYEVGYRAAPTEAFSWDIAGYINDYRKLMGVGPIGAPVFVPPNYVFFPAVFENNTSALSYGVETTANMRMSEVWRLFVSYSVFEVNARGSTPATITQIEGSSPHNQVYLRSSHDLRPELQFDVIGRYVDALTGIGVPGYFEVDSRLGWQATKHWDFSLVGQNLINSHHLEFTDSQGGLVSTQVRRGVYAMATWTR